MSLVVQERDHSCLFALTPIGIGTLWVEGFTGYIVRLANAHTMLPLALIKSEILPLLTTTYSAREKTSGRYRLTSNWWQQISITLNSLNSSTQEWVGALQGLTLQDNLKLLTMLPWANILAKRGLIRREKAWCPDCYREWKADGRPLYDPLIWSLEVIKICPRHHRRLQTRCPFAECRRNTPAIGPCSVTGFCMHCNRWLGNSLLYDHQLPSQAELDAQTWIIEAIEGLLKAAPILDDLPHLSSLSSAIATYIEEKLVGNGKALAHMLGVHHKTVYELRDGRQMPQLGTLLKISSVLETSPLALLTSRIPSGFHRSAVALDVPIVCSQQRPPSFDHARTRQALREIVEAEMNPPPSMRTVAGQLGRDQTFLRKHFLEECTAISKQYHEYVQQQKALNHKRNDERVRQATLTLHKQGIFPSHKRLRAMLGGALRDPSARQIRREILQEIELQGELAEIDIPPIKTPTS